MSNGIKERNVFQRRRNSLWKHHQHGYTTSAGDEKNSYLCLWGNKTPWGIYGKEEWGRETLPQRNSRA